MNISFNTKVYYDLEDELTPHLIRVSVVHSASSTVVDEWNPVIMYTPPTQPTESGFMTIILCVCVCVCVCMCVCVCVCVCVNVLGVYTLVIVLILQTILLYRC